MYPEIKLKPQLMSKAHSLLINEWRDTSICMDLSDPNYEDLPPYLVKYRQNLEQANLKRKNQKQKAIEKAEEIH